MRKELISILTAALLLCSGCTVEKKDAEAASLASYEGYYKAVADNSRFQKGSLYYSISAEMSQLPDGTHRYYVFLDNPQVAMYDIVMMAVENDTALAAVEKSGKTMVYKPTPAERLAFKKALVPVHQKMESRIGKDVIQSIYKDAGFSPDKL